MTERLAHRAAIKTLEEAYTVAYRDNDGTDPCAEEMCLALPIAIEALKAYEQSRWIPVAERLPEYTQAIYAYRPATDDCPAAIVPDSGMMARAHEYTGYTHWAPRIVPAPPEGEK